MGHLHRQAICQRGKARDALAAVLGVAVAEAKDALASVRLAKIQDDPAAPPAAAPKKKAVRRKGKRRGAKKKA